MSAVTRSGLDAVDTPDVDTPDAVDILDGTRAVGTVGVRVGDEEVGVRVLALVGDVEGYVRRRLRTAGTTALVRDQLGDVASVAGEVVGDVAEVLWVKRERWAGLCVEDQRRWTFGVARNLVARRVTAARSTLVRRCEVAPLLDGLGERAGVDPRLTVLAELRLLVESRLGASAWEVVAAAVARNHSPGLRADVGAALGALAEGRPALIRPIVRRCRVDWRPWAMARLESGAPLRPVDAVDLGLFGTLVEATSALTVWWVEHRWVSGLSVDADALAGAGLVDHLAWTPSLRREAAADLLVRFHGAGQGLPVVAA